ncbi:sodium-coupled neutral amino acid symporter 1-like [Lepisosteus oculatus]|uniref:sodium-coupled neutral amino acid symporter 1-like n=1 Tax=Lepisosteus oculatus TaxID=7918 RepID=UPI0037139A93
MKRDGYSAVKQSSDIQDNYGNEDGFPNDGNVEMDIGRDVEREQEQGDFESQTSLTKEHLKNKKYEECGSGRTSFGMSVFNLSNAIMGTGILGLSYALSKTGIFLFLILLLSVAVLSLYSIRLLLECSKKAECMVYEDLGHKAFGMPGKLAVFGSSCLQNIGATLSYMFIVKNELPKVIATLAGLKEDLDVWYLNGNYLVIIVTIGIILPLCLLKSLGYLGYTSGFSLTCMVFFLIVVISKKFTLPCTTEKQNVTNESYLETDHCTAEYFTFNNKSVYAVPTILFAFVCHPSVLPIYSELKERSIKKMEKVSIISFLAMLLMYLLTAVFGYFTFYGSVHEELLHTYSSEGDTIILAVRLAIIVAVVLTVPVLFFVVRSSMLMIIKQKQFKWSWHIGVTLVLLAFCVLLVIFIPSITDIFAIIGATSANMLIFILPASIYLKLHQSIPTKKKIKPFAFLIGGMFCVLLILPLVIIDWIHSIQNKNNAHH